MKNQKKTTSKWGRFLSIGFIRITFMPILTAGKEFFFLPASD